MAEPAHLSELLVSEVETAAVAGSLVLDRLAQMLFVHRTRAHAVRPAGWPAGCSATTASVPHCAPRAQTWRTEVYRAWSRA